MTGLKGLDRALGIGPASIGNFNVAFDVLGAGLLNPYDEIIASKTSKKEEVVIERIIGDGGKLPTNPETNTAGVAARALLQATGAPFGATLSIKKGLPLGSGLGSSAASAVASVMAVNTLLDSPLTKEDLIPFLLDAEEKACGAAHADNAVPSLLGGLVLISTYEPLRVLKLPIENSFWIATITPEIEVSTRDARAVLPEKVSLSLASKQLGLFGGSLLGLLTGDELLVEAHLRDLFLEPFREQFIPGFEEHRNAALDNGALALGISGSGPTVFVIASSESKAHSAADAVKKSFLERDISSETALSPLLSDGASVSEVPKE